MGKILIVDDSRVMRLMVQRTLRQAGFGSHEVREAENGAQGLDTALREHPNVILCDWNMPEMNGIDFLEALRKGGDKTPFVFVTSEGTQGMKDRATAAGALDVIVKPFTPDTFEKVLKGVLA